MKIQQEGACYLKAKLKSCDMTYELVYQVILTVKVIQYWEVVLYSRAGSKSFCISIRIYQYSWQNMKLDTIWGIPETSNVGHNVTLSFSPLASLIHHLLIADQCIKDDQIFIPEHELVFWKVWIFYTSPLLHGKPRFIGFWMWPNFMMSSTASTENKPDVWNGYHKANLCEFLFSLSFGGAYFTLLLN